MDNFRVVPLCDRQLRDINPTDVLNGGLYRKCSVYKGGGGYDRFPYICESRLGYQYGAQFVVQVYGCPLKCPYCYVTPDGVHGEYVNVSTDKLLVDFESSGQDVFHLMGGAPAIYMDLWAGIIDNLRDGVVFHSDLLLVEGEYDVGTLTRIAKPNALYAVSIKGIGEGFKRNTGVDMDEKMGEMFWGNLWAVVECGLNFYFTFTGMSAEEIADFKRLCLEFGYDGSIFKDSFPIQIINYEALK